MALFITYLTQNQSDMTLVITYLTQNQSDMTLVITEWRKEKYKDLKKISFKDFSDALTEVHYDQHVLCQVGNN
jgi:hypothetical protein